MSRKKQLSNIYNKEDDILLITEEKINYDLDEDFELNSDLIKYEFNMIELPFFTKDKKVEDAKAKRYIFSEKNNSYMRVVPSGDQTLISNKIPQEFDEKIFYGILKLSKEQKSKEVVTDYFTLAHYSNVHYNHLERIKDSLERLRRCTIEMHNLYYNAIMKSKMDGKQEFNILQEKEEYTLNKVQELPENRKELYSKYFRNSKISEILVLTLSDKIYKNIENKGYLYFDHKDLLQIDNATARKLYLLITKWHGWEQKPTIKRSCRFIASRIPLSWEKNTQRNTINSIEKACGLLKKKNLISDYVLSRLKPLNKSIVEFYFDGHKSSKLIEYNNNAAKETTGHENLSLSHIEDEFIQDSGQMSLFNIPQSKDIGNFKTLLPEDSRTPANIELVKSYLVSEGKNYVKTSIEYANRNYKDNYDAYLKMTLEKDWSRAEREKKELEEQLKREKELKEAKEKEKATEAERDLKRYAMMRYSNLTADEIAAYNEQAKKHPQFKFLQSDVNAEKISWAEALKTVVITILQKEI